MNNNNKLYVGVDPGKFGGIVTLNYKGDIITKDIIPLVGDDIDLYSFYDIIESIEAIAQAGGYTIHVCIEQVHALFNASSAATFSFGYVVGLIDMMIISKKLPYSKIAPKSWQNSIWLPSEIEREPDIKTVDKKGNDKIKSGKIKTKLTSLKAYKRLFPNVDLRATERSKKPHDGLIDAILIAEYCRRLNY